MIGGRTIGSTISAATQTTKKISAVRVPPIACNFKSGRPKTATTMNPAMRFTTTFRIEENGCEWAFLSALASLQRRATALGANAVANIESFYKKNVVSSPTDFSQLEAHYRLIRYELPRELRWVAKRDRNTFGRMHNSLRDQLDCPYKTFTHDRRDGAEVDKWVVYALYRHNETPITITMSVRACMFHEHIPVIASASPVSSRCGSRLTSSAQSLGLSTMTHVMKYKVDASKTPIQIDFVGEEGPAKDFKAEGIIALDGDTLKLAYSTNIPGFDVNKTYTSADQAVLALVNAYGGKLSAAA